jgi:hypothetical protein
VRVVTAPFARTSRVVHANHIKSYGVGEMLEFDGADHARVQFDGEPAPRTVRTDDLSLERALPLAVRPRHRVIYSVERS